MSLVGDLDSEDLSEHLLSEKRRHPNRSVGKCFPHLSEDMLSLIREGMDNLDESIIYDHGQQPMVDEDEGSDSDGDMNVGATADANIISRRLWLYLLERLQISPQMKWGEVSQSTISRMVEQLTKAKYAVEGE